MQLKIILAFAFMLAAFLPIEAQTAATEKPKIDRTELRRQTFETVWKTVNEKHYDPTFGGVDWLKMREIYEPKAMSAQTDAQFYNVLRQMLNELKLSHFSVYEQTSQAEAVERGDGVIGIELKMIDGKAVVVRVEKGSTAEAAGLKNGFGIEKINGKAVSEILAPLEKNLTAQGQNERVKNLYFERTLMSAIGGKPDTIAALETLNAKNESQIFSAKRYAAKSEMSEALGNFPPQEVVFESKRLEGNVGYIRFNIWVIPQMPKIRAAVREFVDAKGIIFDLRGNPGGIGGMAPGIAGLLLKEQTSLGSMTARTTEQKFIVYPQAKPFDGKIVVLTDYGTASTSEVFAAGMQEIGRAQIVGERSAGAVLPSVFTVLPTGAIFQYVISDYKSPKNIVIEKRGVTPDIEIKQTRQALLDGSDLPLEAALKSIFSN
ncbi:MAG: peptidase [Acidobacteria bacterium]|jgi:carboxyl-terminal processing protease|nr:peptidase [Acidobacteriota bacterium]